MLALSVTEGARERVSCALHADTHRVEPSWAVIAPNPVAHLSLLFSLGGGNVRWHTWKMSSVGEYQKTKKAFMYVD